MKRMHLHVSVPDLAQSIQFYETLFGAPPSVRKPDYAKWMLDDPRVNFAISVRDRAAGLSHVGVQVENAEEVFAQQLDFVAPNWIELERAYIPGVAVIERDDPRAVDVAGLSE